MPSRGARIHVALRDGKRGLIRLWKEETNSGHRFQWPL
jgi:hypothetical protein